MQIFYRYHEQQNAEEFIEIIEYRFQILRETSCGYWIIPEELANYPKSMSGIAERGKRWISKTSRKRYAYPTKREALQNFIARKKKQIQYSTYFLERSKIALNKAETMLKEGE